MGKTKALLLAMLIASAPATILPAEGNRETQSASADALRPASNDVDAELKELLDEIGIRTFEDDIAAVDFAVPALDGEMHRLSDYRGEFVFLNFWATWCPPCREEMPSMDYLHSELADEPFRIVAVNLQENPNVVRQFIGDNGFRFPVLLDSSGRIATNYGVRGLPTSYFISPSGTVLGILVGIRHWDEPELVEAMRRIASVTASAQ